MANNADRIVQRFRRRVDARLEATRAEVEDWAGDSTAFMQQNAPWQDQTGEARRRLGWRRRHPPRLRDGARVSLVLGAKHGYHLELSHGSKYQIMGTTMAVMGPALVRRLRRRIWK